MDKFKRKIQIDEKFKEKTLSININRSKKIERMYYKK